MQHAADLVGLHYGVDKLAIRDNLSLDSRQFGGRTSDIASQH